MRAPTDFKNLPRQMSAFKDQEAGIKSGRIVAGPLGNPAEMMPMPAVKTAAPPIASFLSSVDRLHKNVNTAVGGIKDRISNLKLPKLGLPMMTRPQAVESQPITTSRRRENVDPNTPTPQELEMMLQKGTTDPISTMAGQIVRTASPSAMYQKNPFLATVIPAIHAHLESSGFKNPNAAKPKSKFGWGATLKGYNPPNVETVLQDLMSATVGGRNMADEMKRNPQEASARMRTSDTYQFFRDNPDTNLNEYLMKFAGPVSAENPEAGQNYVSNAIGPLNQYAETLDALMQKRGGSFKKRY